MNEIASSQLTLSFLSRVVSAAEILRITTSWPRNACSAHSAQLTEHTTQIREHTAPGVTKKHQKFIFECWFFPPEIFFEYVVFWKNPYLHT